ncbi:hypothetical protein V0288_11955 [Pannus brasiliensis CCIBt3594]|uniref:Uncharacterized protein n=1 Tax=Pannus brasiliensis CCIBt3594 TaxID=1427578 RepID=A0AAW9QU55_9CHRO
MKAISVEMTRANRRSRVLQNAATAETRVSPKKSIGNGSIDVRSIEDLGILKIGIRRAFLARGFPKYTKISFPARGSPGNYCHASRRNSTR